MIPVAIETTVLAQQRVGVEGAGRARAKPEREQHQDRGEPQHLADQRCRRRKDHDQPKLEQGS
jgi:hypothetical protein